MPLSTTTSSLPYWLASLYLPNIGPGALTRLLAQFGSIEKLFSASHEEWKNARLTAEQIAGLKTPPWKKIETLLAWSKEANHHLIPKDHPDYPERLKEIHYAPSVLFVMGNPLLLQQKQLAIVGSRHASLHGKQQAERFAKQLVEAGLIVTSGLAEGIDGAAHRGALRGQGKTIGVSGTGFHYCYPSIHRELVHHILQMGGTILSELPLEIPPRATNFPHRNRIISGLSIGVLIVEAALKSGSLITAKHALAQNREIFAMPGNTHNPLTRGCHYLIKQGAKLVEHIDDILEELALPAAMTTASSSASLPTHNMRHLSEKERIVFDHITTEVTSIDMIILQSGLTATEVSSILLKLELNGSIQMVVGGYVRQGEA